MYNLTITDLSLEQLNGVVALLGKDIVTEKVEVTQKPGRGRPAKVAEAEKDEVKESPKAEKTPTFLKDKTAEKSAKKTVEYSAVKDITQQLALISRETAKGVLGEFESKSGEGFAMTGTDLKETDWANYIEACKKVLASHEEEKELA